MAQKPQQSHPMQNIVTIDPMLLFQILTHIAENNAGCLEDSFCFELCSVPASLFSSNGVPRLPHKASLAHFIWNATNQEKAELPSDACYVMDRCFMLHLLTWCRGLTYNQLAHSFTTYITQKYGSDTVIVFDGYNSGPTTKDVTHLQRS